MWGAIGSFNPEFYPKIAKQSVAKSIGFLAVFIIIISAVFSYKYTRIIRRHIPEAVLWIEDNFKNIIYGLPVIEIKDGELIFPKEPFSKRMDKNFAFAIEPDNDKFYQAVDKYQSAVVLGERKFAVKNAEGVSGRAKINVYSLKDIKYLKITHIKKGLRAAVEKGGIDITPYTIRYFFDKVSVFIFPFLFIWFASVYFFTKPLQIFFFSIFSLIFNTSLKASFNYKQLLNINIYALVPPTTLAIIAGLMSLRIPFFWVVYSGTYITYIFLGMREAKETVNTVNTVNADDHR